MNWLSLGVWWTVLYVLPLVSCSAYEECGIARRNSGCCGSIERTEPWVGFVWKTGVYAVDLKWSDPCLVNGWYSVDLDDKIGSNALIGIVSEDCWRQVISAQDRFAMVGFRVVNEVISRNDERSLDRKDPNAGSDWSYSWRGPRRVDPIRPFEWRIPQLELIKSIVTELEPCDVDGNLHLQIELNGIRVSVNIKGDHRFVIVVAKRRFLDQAEVMLMELPR